MKKNLFATTALVTVASVMGTAEAADPIKLSLGGYATTGVTIRSQRNIGTAAGADDRVLTTNAAGVPITTDLGRSDVFWEGEVHFVGETTLDNGIKVGVNIQLEAYTSNDQIDEHFVYIEGGFGRLVVGAENSSMYLMHYSAPSPTGSDFGADSPNFVPFRNPPSNASAGSVRTFSQLTNDANKLTYYTPRFAPGFQFGVSYTPDDDAFQGVQNAPFGNSCLGGCAFDAGNGISDNDGLNAVGSFHHHFVEAAVNFVRSINGVDLAFDIGYGTGFVEKQIRAGTDPTIKQRHTAAAGFNLSWSGWTFGVGALWDNQGVQGPNDRWDFSAGVLYSVGPWTFGVNGGYAIVQDGRSLVGGVYNRQSNDTLLAGELGLAYTLGPGIKLFGAANIYNWEGNGARTEESLGLAFSSGIQLSF